MRNYRWLLFDADNTLFDFDAAEEHLLTHTFLHFGVEPSKALMDRYRAINGAMWAAFNRGEISQEALVVERYRLFLEQEGIAGDPAAWNDYGLRCLARDPVLLPGAEELCRALAGRYTLALVTNGVAFVQRERLERSPLREFFGERVYISGEMGCRKPERAYFDRVLAHLGAQEERDRALVIGDSLSSDIQGAVNAGLDSVWLSPEGARAGEVRPTYRAATLEQIGELLLQGV